MEALFRENGGEGYFDVTGFQWKSAHLLIPNLGLLFKSMIPGHNSFKIKLENIVSFTEGTMPDKVFWLRIDPDGSSFGLDMALRFKDMSIAKYQALYLFTDVEHTSFVFRAIAEKISIHDIKNKDEEVWPFRP